MGATGVATLHGFFSRGFPNCFIISNAQSGFTVNFPHMLNEQAGTSPMSIAEAGRAAGADVGADARRPRTPGSRRSSTSAILRQAFLEECTPGYYNNEGRPSALAARNGPYGGGPDRLREDAGGLARRGRAGGAGAELAGRTRRLHRRSVQGPSRVQGEARLLGGGGVGLVVQLALELGRRNQERVDHGATNGTDRKIAEAIAVAGGSTVFKLGLRFDRVVVQVLDRLRRFVDAAQPEGVTVVLTLTAPIRAPAKTAVALEQEMAALLQTRDLGSERSAILFGNRAELRLVERASRQGPRLLGFVHNPDVDAARVLELVERWLRCGAESPQERRS